jgi:acyl-coenzyme A synthetase/AMP-(fatty) acid ligase/aryl carrier-like protein
MYTSGSTGKPKGVMVEHRGMVNHVLAKLADLEMGADCVLAQNGPPTFDIVVWQCLAPLVVGGRVVVFPDAIAEDPALLVDEIERRGVTVLQIVPSMLRALLDEAETRKPQLASLRWMVPTGEALPTELCRRWLALYPHIPILNTYGSTECSDDQCHDAIRALDAADDAVAIASIGRPIHNMAAYVLDATLEPVPPGVVGELYIGGIGVGRGYIGDPERTLAAFVPDPFSDGRLYRTRDLARRRPSGRIDFLGRVDNMIKLRGFRIEPGEIEAALVAHPAVAAAAVIAQPHPSAERVLVGYVVAKSAVTAEELREHLAARLPQYMVPTTFSFLDALPLTANGKLDARALPVPRWDVSDEVLIAPRNALEEQIAAIWTEVLGLGRVGVTQDFFEIGGDSIKSIQIVARCRRAGFDVSPRDLFQFPTIAGFAAAAARGAVQDERVADIEIASGELELALSQVVFE